MRSKLPWPEILVTALVIVAGAGVYLYAHRDEAALEESKRRGQLLVAALHAYEREHGSYPETLESLVPVHATAIAPPTWGLRRWRYRRYTPAEVVPSIAEAATGQADARTPRGGAGVLERSGEQSDSDQPVYFQLSVAADESGYPVLYYDFASRRWVLNN